MISSSRILRETNLLSLKFGNLLKVIKAVISMKALTKKKRHEDQIEM